MTTYTIEYTETENKAMEYAAASVDDWIQNAAHERCRIAMEEIIAAEVQRLLGEGKPITGSKDDIVMAADIETAAERNERIAAEDAARANA